MNNDLISRSKVIEELNYLKHIGYDNSGVMKLQNMEIQRCISVIEDAPTALFPLTVQIVDKITDEEIELLKQILKDCNPQILNLETERPQGEYTEEDIKQTIKENFDIGYGMAKNKYERPQGEREFIEILAQDVPDDLCTYPEYRGKPYYSIHYKENGEEFVGFGTYNPEVLSRYLRDYFIKGGAE